MLFNVDNSVVFISPETEVGISLENLQYEIYAIRNTELPASDIIVQILILVNDLYIVGFFKLFH